MSGTAAAKLVARVSGSVADCASASDSRRPKITSFNLRVSASG